MKYFRKKEHNRDQIYLHEVRMITEETLSEDKQIFFLFLIGLTKFVESNHTKNMLDCKYIMYLYIFTYVFI